ncbi:hypothetical protein Aperf_G00000034250 [Anoplocephala perfoliata]
MPGDIYLRILTLTISPLIVANIFLGSPCEVGSSALWESPPLFVEPLLAVSWAQPEQQLSNPGSRILLEGDESEAQIKGSGLAASDVFKDIFLHFCCCIENYGHFSAYWSTPNYYETASMDLNLHERLILTPVGVRFMAAGSPAPDLLDSAHSFTVRDHLFLFALLLRPHIGEMYKQLDKYGCKEIAFRFVLPVTCVMKADSPAIFISVACMFIVQQSRVEMDASKIIFIMWNCNFCWLAYLRAMPYIPSASVVLVVTALTSIGLPSESASLLYAMEWLLDRCWSGLAGISAMYISAMTSEIYERRKSVEEEAFDEELNGSIGADHSISVEEA